LDEKMKKLLVFAVCLCLAACTANTSVPEPVPSETPLPTPVVINLPLVDAPQLTQFYFVNENDGWGVTESQVVRTKDGGVTWFNATPPVSAQFGYAPFFFLNAQTAWTLIPAEDYLTGMLYHTTDGGSTWGTSVVPFAYTSLQFLDPNAGFALAALGAGAGSEVVALYQTSDAGRNWTRIFINDPNEPGANDSLPLGGQKYGFAFLDSSRGWVGGSVPVDNYIYLFRTTDGGSTWSEVSLALPAGAESAQTGNSGPQFFSATEGILVVSLVMSSDPGLATIVYRTGDGGETWQPGQIIPSGRPTKFNTFLEGVAWGGGQFYRTNDAGQTWNAFTPGEDFTALLGSFQFTNPLIGWVLTTNEASDPSLYKTIDGGATWTLLIP
jgi:photosystem II stability/assembly factor-like uncharacterized protein